MQPSPTSGTSTSLRFRPFPLLSSPHAQTVLASQLSFTHEPPSETQLITLSDGDRLALEMSTPSEWLPQGHTIVLVHGLCGCHLSSYMIRLARKFWHRGARVVRMNLRGCGSGQGLARQPYHSGRSDDLLAILKTLRNAMPHSPITLIGFSLGGNLVLKLAGELNCSGSVYLRQVIAVCPSADLSACADKIAQSSNRLYERRFIRLLKAAMATRYAHFPDLPRISLPTQLSIREFDDYFTAPTCGFDGADDYYRRCSAVPLVPEIAIPCRILFSQDDPFIDSSVFASMTLPAHIQVYYTERGGHLGFLGRLGHEGSYRWMDTQLLNWWEAS